MALVGDRPPDLCAESRKRYQALIEADSSHLAIALELLGCREVLAHTPEDLLDVHRWISQCLPRACVQHLARTLEPIPSSTLSEALYISLRTLHRKKHAHSETLSVAQSGHVFKLTEVVAQASRLFDSPQVAARRLTSPAIGLNRYTPIALLTVFVASDSARAKQTAVELAESIGFEAVDAGGLKNAHYLEPLAGLNIYLGYGAGLGTAIAPTWIRKA